MKLIEETPYRFRIERHEDMRVPGVVFATASLLPRPDGDQALQQVVNVATLPGIVEASYAMPDIHWGYGFPIGGVAATDVRADGVVSPGGVGFDISCGVRLLAADLDRTEFTAVANRIMDALARRIPRGAGPGAMWPVSGQAELDKVLLGDSRYAVEQGRGNARDLARCEDGGLVDDADPAQVGERAMTRGLRQDLQRPGAAGDRGARSVVAGFGRGDAGGVQGRRRGGGRGPGRRLVPHHRPVGAAGCGEGVSRPDRGHCSVPHTADLRIEAWGPTREVCLAEAVAALVASFADTAGARPIRTLVSDLAARTDADLLATVLDEVIYVLDTQGAVVLGLDAEGRPGGLRAHLPVISVHEVHIVGAIPKAVALSGLRCTSTGQHWSCAATIDV